MFVFKPLSEKGLEDNAGQTQQNGSTKLFVSPNRFDCLDATTEYPLSVTSFFADGYNIEYINGHGNTAPIGCDNTVCIIFQWTSAIIIDILFENL